MDISAEALLQGYDLSSLQQMAKVQHVRAGSGGKNVFVPALASSLFDAARKA